MFQVKICDLFFLPGKIGDPIKPLAELHSPVLYARACLYLNTSSGSVISGWGEAELNPVEPWNNSQADYSLRQRRMRELCDDLANAWRNTSEQETVDLLAEIFRKDHLPAVLAQCNQKHSVQIPAPIALLCNSAFEMALKNGKEIE